MGLFKQFYYKAVFSELLTDNWLQSSLQEENADVYTCLGIPSGMWGIFLKKGSGEGAGGATGIPTRMPGWVSRRTVWGLLPFLRRRKN